jgi:dTDP-4-dehydrorhamnose reductase
MERILVIGARGMLGRDLVEELRSSWEAKPDPAWEIIGWDIEEIDIRDERRTIEAIEKVKPQVLVNVAAYTDVDGCETEQEKAFSVNAEGMKHLALGARKIRAKVVYLSTDYVFDGSKSEPYLETDPPRPLNVYGLSKLQGERYVETLAEDGLIIRTQWLYGRYGKNFVDSVLRQAEEKRVLSIVHDQVGSPTYTVDLSRAISALIRHRATGIFHVTNSGVCSWYAFGEAVLKWSGRSEVRVVPITTQELNRPARRPLYSALSGERLRRETGMALRPWQDALRDYLRSVGRLASEPSATKEDGESPRLSGGEGKSL